MGAITVTGLCTYPVKSCAGVSVEEALITPRGLEHDRDYMVVEEDGTFVSQRTVPELALVVPTLRADVIELAAPGMETLEVPLAPPPAEHVDATVHGKPVAGQRLGEAWDEWFTTFLPPREGGGGYRLLRVREDAPRYVSEHYRRAEASNQVGFADGHSMLLASERSLARLCEEMEAPVPMNRFRPNIVVDGEGLEPYDEDFWTALRVGPLEAFVVKGCDRCTIPDVDQDTAVVGKAVRRALVSRRGFNAHDEANTGVFFAQNLVHVFRPGTRLRVGDTVDVLERSPDANVVLRRGGA